MLHIEIIRTFLYLILVGLVFQVGQQLSLALFIFADAIIGLLKLATQSCHFFRKGFFRLFELVHFTLALHRGGARKVSQRLWSFSFMRSL